MCGARLSGIQLICKHTNPIRQPNARKVVANPVASVTTPPTAGAIVPPAYKIATRTPNAAVRFDGEVTSAVKANIALMKP
jgi:hypothetical protein